MDEIVPKKRYQRVEKKVKNFSYNAFSDCRVLKQDIERGSILVF